MLGKQRILCLTPGRITPGMALAKAIHDREGNVLLAAGAVLDLAILEKLMRRGIGAAFIQVPDTRDTATIAGELCSVNARIERIFRGPSNTVRDELRVAVQEFRSETSK